MVDSPPLHGMRIRQLEPQNAFASHPTFTQRRKASLLSDWTGGLHHTTLNLLQDTGCSPQGPCYFPRVRDKRDGFVPRQMLGGVPRSPNMLTTYTMLGQTSTPVQHPTALPEHGSATKLIHAIQLDFRSLLSIFPPFICASVAKVIGMGL